MILASVEPSTSRLGLELASIRNGLRSRSSMKSNPNIYIIKQIPRNKIIDERGSISVQHYGWDQLQFTSEWVSHPWWILLNLQFLDISRTRRMIVCYSFSTSHIHLLFSGWHRWWDELIYFIDFSDCTTCWWFLDTHHYTNTLWWCHWHWWSGWSIWYQIFFCCRGKVVRGIFEWLMTDYWWYFYFLFEI